MSGIIDLVFLSAGGTAVDVLDLVHDVNDLRPTFRPLGYLDDAPHLNGTTVQGLPVLGRLSDHREFKNAYFLNCLGAPGNYWRRRSIVDALGIPPQRLATVIHPTAVISRSATIGEGSIIYPYAFVGSSAQLGRQVLVMSHVSINHEVSIGNHSIVASSAIVLGKVSIGESAYIGAGASIHQGRTVGAHALVGMGTVVLKDVPERHVVAGTPARYLRSINTD